GVPPLALTLVAGDLGVATLGHGRGLLFVDGLLDITGTFQFSGVVVASAGIRVASAGRLDGACAVSLRHGAALTIREEAPDAADAAAVGAADGLLALRRRAVVTSLRASS